MHPETHPRSSRLAALSIGLIAVSAFATLAASDLRAQTSGRSLPAEPSIDDIIAAGERDSRIVGGVASARGQWQSLIAIFKRVPGREPFNFCGGTIIGKEWVLTAAHCAAAMRREPASSTFFVREGTIDLAARDGRDIVVNRNQIVVHENYNPELTLNDVALLRLDGSATAPRQKLTGRTEMTAALVAGRMSTVAGFGRTSSSGTSSNRLLQVDLPIVDQAECRKVYGGNKITDATFCAGLKEGGKDSCQGDSGGPLFLPNRGGEQMQTGVVSWGKGCAEAGYYGVYASVGQFQDWIRSRVRDVVFVDGASPGKPPAVTDSAAAALASGATETGKPSQIAQITLDIAEGDQLKVGSYIEVRVTSSIAGTVVIYNENPDGRAYQLYPSRAFPAPGGNTNSARIEPGRLLSIPSAAQRDAGYRFILRPPLGLNKLRAVVVPTSRKMDDIIGRHVNGDDIADLAAVLNEIVDAELQTRGPEPVKIDPVDRGTAERIYHIVD